MNLLLSSRIIETRERAELRTEMLGKSEKTCTREERNASFVVVAVRVWAMPCSLSLHCDSASDAFPDA